MVHFQFYKQNTTTKLLLFKYYTLTVFSHINYNTISFIALFHLGPPDNVHSFVQALFEHKTFIISNIHLKLKIYVKYMYEDKEMYE